MSASIRHYAFARSLTRQKPADAPPPVLSFLWNHIASVYDTLIWQKKYLRWQEFVESCRAVHRNVDKETAEAHEL